MIENNDKLPHWDVTNVYPGLEAPEFLKAMQDLDECNDDLETYLSDHKINRTVSSPLQRDIAVLGETVSGLIDRINASYLLAITLRSYVNAFITTDSFNTTATHWLSKVQTQIVRFQQMERVARGWIGTLGSSLTEAIHSTPNTREHAFYLQEASDQSKYLMSDAEESLAGDLSLSGIRAWGKLHGTITSQVKVDFELDGDIKQLPMPALQNVRRSNPDETVRHRAFDTEISVWESLREPLAACMNGVKGYDNVLSRRRGREDQLHRSIDQARIDRPTLDAMMEAMRASFPDFRRYLNSKAGRLGKDTLAWWDLFAPVGENERYFTWDQTQAFIVDVFATFSDDLSDFAQKAFDRHWIDAEPRPGKRGGAFCMSLPAVEESRILCNFDGTFDQLSTVAHELGHGYHNKCRAGKTSLQRITPMTMAETASILCETIITNAALERTDNPKEKLAILETSLIGSTQVIVDITSRFLFEKEVYERRQEADLSADDFCEIMTRAQKATYGDGLDENHLHPYMWAWKSHYYRADISFYNYPYAFGLLFGTGLYAIYQERGDAFIPEYVELLGSTGLGSASDLANRFDIDLRSPNFWESSLDVIRAQIELYQTL